jgi:predicted nucleotidyltransferase
MNDEQMKAIDLYSRLSTSPARVQEICQQWQIIELALFGSVLREDFCTESDIDVLIAFAPNTPITFFDLDRLEDQLSQMFQRSVDVVTRRSIEQSHNWIRRQNILGKAKVIYEQR